MHPTITSTHTVALSAPLFHPLGPVTFISQWYQPSTHVCLQSHDHLRKLICAAPLCLP